MPSSATLPDARLVERCRAGDQDAWGELVDRFSAYVYAIVVQGFRLYGQDAEDVFQEVFTKAYENIGRLRDDSAVRAWLAQLTRNACIDLLRARQREQPADEVLEPTEVDETLARLAEAVAVHDSLQRLSPECREILDRFFTRDESYRTIGAELGIPAGTIASRISRCLDKLRDEFEGR
jgi:RNA polymerase sigma factor (sigma-70 family)